jgi:predicted PurR-regulated permease PerM
VLDRSDELTERLTTAFSGIVAFVTGPLIGMFLLYFILADWERLRSWVADHLSVPRELGTEIVDNDTSVIRLGSPPSRCRAS